MVIKTDEHTSILKIIFLKTNIDVYFNKNHSNKNQFIIITLLIIGI